MRIPKLLRNFLKQREMINFYKQFVKEGDLCFDIGANVGDRTKTFFKLGAKVIAVEPQNKCYNILQQKYLHNKQVEVLNCAIGNKEGEAELMICLQTDQCSTLSGDFVSAYTNLSGFNWPTTEKIRLKTLESLCSQYGVPKFCKIDVEGYESEVLRGLKSPIKFIAFEFNRPLLNDTLKCLSILALHGNYQCNFIKYELMNLVLDEWMPLEEFENKFEEIITPDIPTGEIIVERLS